MLYKVKKGLDVPITGAPTHTIDDAPPARRVALTTYEHIALKARLDVAVGDKVKRGQSLLTHKQFEGVHFLSPAGGVVREIVRGERRRLLSIIIETDESDNESPRIVEPVAPEAINGLSRDAVVKSVLNGGLWSALRTRPYSKIPDPQSVPNAIFVAAMDTRPLAVPAGMIIQEHQQAFRLGLEVLAHISGGTVHVCHSPVDEMPSVSDERIQYSQFEGPHPAGLPGTHIHFIQPLAADKVVWTINYADTIAIGQLFLSGEYPTERIVSLAGPSVTNPRLLRTRIGACIDELCNGELRMEDGDENRIVIGSVMDGYESTAETGFLSRFALQVSALPVHPERKFMAWVRPGLDLYSVSNTLFSKLMPARKFAFNCGYNGSARNIVPIGLYERVYPLMPMATQLLKSLLVADTDTAKDLGCLELDEEDLAICSYVCPGKNDFGPALRRSLELLEKNG